MSTIDQTEIITTKYQIEPNPAYDFNHKSTDTYVVQNIAEDVNYTDIATTSTNRYQLTFQLDPANVFMDRGVQLRLDIPLLFERTTAATTTPVETDYVKSFFDDYTSFAWKQFGFINAMQNISVTMDGFTYTVTDVAEIMKIVSRYYDEDIVHQRVPASLPDVMDYNNYNETSAAIKTCPLDNTSKMMIKPSVIKSHNIFGTLGNPDFNTRTPMIAFDLYTAPQLKGSIISETCFIPFSIFGISGLDTQPLTGVKSMSLRINLKSNWEKHLFCTKASFMKSVKFDDSRVNSFKANLSYRTYCPPQYIDEAHGLSRHVPDYNHKFQVVELQNSVQTVSFLETDISKTIPTMSYKIKAIPKAIYLAATLKAVSEDHLMSTPDVFTRINSFNIEVAGKKTTLPSHPTGIMDIAKANGYQDSMEIGYYLGGYPVKINTTDDIGAKSNALVGSTQNVQNEIRIHNINMSNVARFGQKCDYELRLICVYDSLLAYRNGKFTLMESLLESETDINVQAHVSELYNHQIQKMNMIGGSFGSLFAASVPTLKKVGKGAFNVVKRFATDKKFRSQVLDAYNNVKRTVEGTPQNFVEKGTSSRPVNFVETTTGGFSNVIGAGGYSSHVPIGGRPVGNIRY